MIDFLEINLTRNVKYKENIKILLNGIKADLSEWEH